MYVVVEGSDLVGKSTFITKLKKHYEKLGKEVVVVTEPYKGHHTGQKIRDFLKDKHTNSDELYGLYRENRDYLWYAVIRPSLEAGKIVISDRNYLSSMVYQESMGMMTILGHNTKNQPDVLYYLSISHATYLKRLAKKKNVEFIETELANIDKFNKQAKRYKEALRLMINLNNVFVIPVKESAYGD